MAGEKSDLSISAVFHDGEPIRSIGITSISCADRAGDLHTLKSRTGDTIPVGPSNAILLVQNRPNPFNPATSIRYVVDRASHVTLQVYSLSGQLVRTLVDREHSAGNKEVTWDGTNDAGYPVASGIYVYRLRVGRVTESKKMILLK